MTGILIPALRQCSDVICNSSMHKVLLLFLLFLIVGSSSHGQDKIYKLIDSARNADIDIAKMTGIDYFQGGIDLLNTAFKPTMGKYTIYRFMATYEGMSFTDSIKTFHDVLIVKTDDSRNVLSAFHYTLEWAEPPFETDLYVNTIKKLLLSNGMRISSFGFQNLLESDPDRELIDEGKVSW